MEWGMSTESQFLEKIVPEQTGRWMRMIERRPGGRTGRDSKVSASGTCPHRSGTSATAQDIGYRPGMEASILHAQTAVALVHGGTQVVVFSEGPHGSGPNVVIARYGAGHIVTVDGMRSAVNCIESFECSEDLIRLHFAEQSAQDLGIGNPMECHVARHADVALHGALAAITHR
jgi:hypothetical protein